MPAPSILQVQGVQITVPKPSGTATPAELFKALADKHVVLLMNMDTIQAFFEREHAGLPEHAPGRVTGFIKGSTKSVRHSV